MATVVSCPKCNANVSQVYTLCPQCFSPIARTPSAPTPPQKTSPINLHSTQTAKPPGKIQTGFPWLALTTLALALLGTASLAANHFSTTTNISGPAQSIQTSAEASLAKTTEPSDESQPAPNARERIKMSRVAMRSGDLEQARIQAENALSLVNSQADATASQSDLKECHEILLDCELALHQSEAALYHSQWLWRTETQHLPKQASQRNELLAQAEKSWLSELRATNLQSNKALRLNHLRDLFQVSQDLGLFEKPEPAVRQQLGAAHLQAAHLSANVKDYSDARIFLTNAEIYGTRDPALSKLLSQQKTSNVVANSSSSFSPVRLEQPKPTVTSARPQQVRISSSTRQSYPVASHQTTGPTRTAKKPGRINPDAEMEALQEQMHKQQQAKQPVQQASTPQFRLPEIKVESGANSNSIPGYYGSSRVRDTLPGY